MRILHVVPTYIPAWRYGGPIHSVHGLCRALAARGHDVHVATTNVDGDSDSDVRLDGPVALDGVAVHYFPSARMRRLYYSPPMHRYLAAELARFDVVHTHSTFLWPTTAAARIARVKGTPYVLSPRGMLVGELIRRRSRWLKQAWIALFERRNVESAAAVHFTSVVERDDVLAAGFRPRRTFVIPNGFDPPPQDRGAAAIPPGLPRPYVLFLGRISWKKGLDRLVAALAQAAGVNLVVAGNDDEGYWPTIAALARELGVDGRIYYVGFVEGDAKSALLSNAVALALPSYSENFANVVLESMAAGTPVAVCPEVGAAEIVAQTASGIVAAGEPAVFGAALARLVADRALRDEMGRNARAAARSLGWDAIARRFEEEYGLVARNAPRAAAPVNLRSITPVILTFDEEPNIGRTLAALAWAADIVVVDSMSTDRTVEIAEAHPNVRVFRRAFDVHARQWNFAIGETGIATEWILALDADYVLPEALVAELRGIEPAAQTAGYRTRFDYCVFGHPLRGSVYPPVTTLFRRGRGAYRQDGHTQRVQVDGPVEALANPIRHDDRKSLGRWLASQSRYMELEAEKLEGGLEPLGLPDRIRKWVVVAPIVVPLHVLLAKGAILDGRAGLFYALQRGAAEAILSLHLLRRRLG